MFGLQQACPWLFSYLLTRPNHLPRKRFVREVFPETAQSMGSIDDWKHSYQPWLAFSKFTAADAKVLELLPQHKPVLLLANKCDAPTIDMEAMSLYSLGFDHVYTVAAEHGRDGLGLDRGRMDVALVGEGPLDLRRQAEVGKAHARRCCRGNCPGLVVHRCFRHYSFQALNRSALRPLRFGASVAGSARRTLDGRACRRLVRGPGPAR